MTMASISSRTWVLCNSCQLFECLAIIHHQSCEHQSQTMYTFLLFINILDCFELSETDNHRIYSLCFCVLNQFGLEKRTQDDSFFLNQIDFVLFLQELNIIQFSRHNEANTLALWCNTRSASNSVNIFFDWTWQVPLQNPFNCFKVKPTGSDIRANEQALFIFIELKVVFLAFRVFHIPMQLVNTCIEQCLNLLSLFIFVLLFKVKYLRVIFLTLPASPVNTVPPIQLLQQLV